MIHNKTLHFTIVNVVVVIVAVVVSANVVAADKLLSFSAVDTYILQNDITPQGTAESLLAGRDNMFQIMMKFPDIVLPEGASLVRASLSLFAVSSEEEDIPADLFQGHRLLVDWNANDTYATAFGGDGIQTDGMQDAVSEPSFVFPQLNFGLLRYNVTADVAHWLENPSQNFGWGIVANQAGEELLGLASSDITGSLDALPTLLIQTNLPYTQADRKNHKIRIAPNLGCQGDTVLWVGEKETSLKCRRKCLKRKTRCIGFQFEAEASTCTLFEGDFLLEFSRDVNGTDCGFLRYKGAQ